MGASPSERLRYVLVVLVAAAVVSASVGMVAAFHGIVVRGGDEPTFNPGVGGPSTVVVSNATPVVYRGESNIVFELPSEESVAPGRLIGASGPAEGQPLQLPIPEDQTVGLYTLGGRRPSPGVIVQTPRITDLTIVNERGFDVRDATVTEDTTLLVEASWNFRRAEDLSLVVRNDRGTDITGQVLTSVDDLSSTQRAMLSGPYATFPERVGNVGERGTGTGIQYIQGLGQFTRAELANSSRLDAAYWALDLGEAGPGNVTVTVEGWDSLDAGPASRTATVEVTTESETTLGLDPEEATRGQRVQFLVRGSTIGAVHTVVVERDAFRDDDADERVFDPVGNVIDRGTVDADDDGTAEFAYATVQIDDNTGFGEGRIDTSRLEDTGVDVRVFEAGQNLSSIARDVGDPVDERTLDVVEPTIAIDRPAGVYVAGDGVDVDGTASRGIDEVALYVRNGDDWELLDVNEDGSLTRADTVSVAGDGDWEVEDVTLSAANRRLSFEGQYDLGVVEAADVAENGRLPATLTNGQFSGATSAQTTLLVKPPRLELGQTVTLINDQLAVEDGTVDVRGTAPGLDRVLVVMVDEQGAVSTEQIPVDEDDVFERDDVDLSTPEGRELARGPIEGFLLGVGRDNVVGDGQLPNQDRATLGAFEDFVKALSATGQTQSQLTARILAETTNDTASDDLLIRESFEYTSASTRITAVVPQQFADADGVTRIEVGETMLVRGETNRQPEQNTITVAAIAGPATGALPVASTEEWGVNGSWSVTIDTSGLEPGVYTLEADDGASTDQVDVRVVPAGERGPLDGGGNDSNASRSTRPRRSCGQAAGAVDCR